MDKQLRFVVSATDKGAGKTISGVAEKGESAGKRLGGAFAKAGNAIGGELGEILNKTSEGLDSLGERGMSAGKKISALGGGVAVLGGALTMMGQKEKQSTDELASSIEATGHSIGDYREQIEKSVKSGEKFGDTAVQSKRALQILTDATHDPTKAFGLMSGAEDLAAASHISLEDASTQLAKALGGSGRIFKQYGIVVKTNADGTKDYAGAVAQLTTQLHGRADAAADNLTGKFKHLRAEVTDGVAAFGEKYGPALTTVGVGMIALGPIIGKAGSLIGKMGAASTTAAAETAAADTVIVTSNETAAESEVALAGASRAAATAIAASDAEVVTANLATRASFIGLGTAIGVLGTAALVLPSINADTIDGNNQLVVAYKQQTHSTDMSAQSILKWAATAKGLSGINNVVTEPLKGLKLTTDQLAVGVSGTDEAYKKWIATLKTHGKVSSADKQALDQLHKLFKTTAPAIKEVSDATDTGAKAMSTFGSYAHQTHDAIGLLTKGLQTLGQTQIGAAQDEAQFLDGLDQLTQSFKDNGKSIGLNTAKGRANREALLSNLSAALQSANANRANGKSIKDVTGTLNANVTQLVRTAVHAGASRGEVAKLVRQMGLTPKQIETTFKADTAPAYASFNKLVADLRAAAANAGIIVSVNAEGGLTTTRGGTRNGNAGGTDFFSGGRTGIAERGEPEIVAARGVSITPMSKLSNGGAGDKHLHIHLEGSTFIGNDGPRAVVAALEQWAQTGGHMRISQAVR